MCTNRGAGADGVPPFCDYRTQLNLRLFDIGSTTPSVVGQNVGQWKKFQYWLAGWQAR